MTVSYILTELWGLIFIFNLNNIILIKKINQVFYYILPGKPGNWVTLKFFIFNFLKPGYISVPNQLHPETKFQNYKNDINILMTSMYLL